MDQKKKIIATVTVLSGFAGYEAIKQQIMELCKNTLIKEAVPREIVVKEKMPETMYLKTDITALQEEYSQKQKVKTKEGNL